MVDGSGNPVGYSESAHFPHQQTNGAETFPIPLKEGVVLKKTGSTPVYVWSGSGTGVTLIDVQEQTGTPNLITRIEALRLAGATTGIQVHHGNHDTVTVIKDCKFGGLKTSVDARATGFDISVAIRDCQIRDDTITTSSVPPAMQSLSRGYWLRAAEVGASRGHLIAEVKNHASTGPFSSMDPQPWGAIWDQPATPSGTRVIEVFASGGTPEYQGLPASYARTRIAEVRLDVDGGVFDGHASDGGTGWDAAILANAQGSGVADSTYNAGYEVTFSGSELTDFRMSGIVALAQVTARGLVEINGGTLIHGNAPGFSPSADSHNGVHLVQSESYLGFLASNAIIAENAGHGIWMNARGEIVGFTHEVPEGLYLEMDQVGVHGNGASGLRGHVGKTHAGVLGGTSHYVEIGEPPFSTWTRNLVDDGEGFAVPFGTGLVDSCKISNNGIGGVHISAEGNPTYAYQESAPDTAAETVSFRLSNTAIWNNPKNLGGFPGLGGLFVTHGGVKNEPKGLVLLPVTHCTMVNNGGPLTSGGWTVEFDDPHAVCAYEWARAHESEVLRTAIFNSVFFRDYQTPDPSGNSDFGPFLETVLGVYDDDGFAPFPLRGILMCGLRADTSVIPGSAGDAHGNKAAHVFSGPLSIGSYNANQFLLTGGVVFDQYYSVTPNFLSAHAPETDEDLQDDPRAPISSGQRDKGMDEL